MKRLKIYDMTLRAPAGRKDGKLSFKEKLEIAKLLDHLRVDVIELPPIGNTKADKLANSTITAMVKNGISAAVMIGSGAIDETWESIKGAVHPQLNLLVPLSTVQMEYICHKKAPAMLPLITEEIKKCRFYCEKVEFTALDATRAEPEFLKSAISTAIEAGADRITICDTAGLSLPDEFGAFIADLKKDVKGFENAELYVELSDDMGMAGACAAAAVKAGADGVKCTAVASGYPTLDQMAVFMEKKGAQLDMNCALGTTDLTRTISRIRDVLAPASENEKPFRDMADDGTEVTLDENDDISEVIKVIKKMGYDLSEEDNAKVYEAFMRVARKKHYVGTKELDAIIASTAMQVPSNYRLENYVINSGNIITATANILIDKNGEKIRGIGCGDGPIDAAFLAIEQIIGHHYEVDDFQIRTVTEGRDAMGSALVKLRTDGRGYSGSGISTDIIGASIRAYISALNKIVYDQG